MSLIASKCHLCLEGFDKNKTVVIWQDAFCERCLNLLSDSAKTRIEQALYYAGFIPCRENLLDWGIKEGWLH